MRGSGFSVGAARCACLRWPVGFARYAAERVAVSFFSGKRIFDPQFFHDQLDCCAQQPGRPGETGIDEGAIHLRDGGTSVPYDAKIRLFAPSMKRPGNEKGRLRGWRIVCFGASKLIVWRAVEKSWEGFFSDQ